MLERRKSTVIDSLKRPFQAVGEIFQTRDGLEAARLAREAKLEAIGGLDAVKTMPMHDIEEALGLNDLPMVDKYGNTYPSRNQTQKESAKHEKHLDQFLAEREDHPRVGATLFERIQGYYVEKARSERDSSIEAVSQEQGE